MATKKVAATITTATQIRNQLMEMRLNIRAGQQKNTNAHKPLKKQLAQLLTKRVTVTP